MTTKSSIVKVSKGDIVHVEYNAYLAESGMLFDTTNADKAKEAEIFNENLTYKPLPLLVGGGRVFPGLDEALAEAKVGELTVVEIPAEKAAGARDPKLVENIALREFFRQEIRPEIGMEVNMKNRVGTVVAVTNRMVRVDFNRRFAGAALRYEFTVLDKVEGDEAKVMSICEMDYSTAEGFRAIVTEGKVVLYLPDVCKYDQKWLLTKYKVVADLRDAFGAVTVELVEEYLKKEDKPVEVAPAELAEEKSPEEL
ncbi:MAG TPA: FKBP-type peptidyl-prolyl cis-trans isomerase [Methanomassiliicoccales archaeon]|nr:FKBP-type peptidyl-prolyl cis-trans isomerase [Methanomassiliicoccales archaeon]HPR98290.1 FKBP-type peptidyl-prolyl cis-trans isomerase [Methanomassiliicoccales archaeon]